MSVLAPAVSPNRRRRPTARLITALAGGIAWLALGAGTAGALPIGAYTSQGAWGFASAPGLHPPKLLIDGPARWGSLARGDFLLDNFPNIAAPGPMTGQGGPLIVDSHLNPVWFQPIAANRVSADLEQETYLGRPVLVWWQGLLTSRGATTRGEVHVVDDRYRPILTLRAPAPWIIDLHDAIVSGPDIWVSVIRDVHGQNLTAYGGARNGTVEDVGVQEYDVATGALLYTWDALNPGGAPNLPLALSEQPPPAASRAWDAYHLNSIEVLPFNQLLVSFRNTWSVELIDTATGGIVWSLGGRRSTFFFAPAARFAWQHDAELAPGGLLTLFDDNCCKARRSGGLAAANGPSAGKVLRLDMARHTVTLVAAYAHHPTRDSAFLGSMQLLPGADALVGWGSLPYFSEFSRSGRLLLDVTWPGKDQSYRSLFTSSWVASPAYPPSGAARRTGGGVTVLASWNGATKVRAWQVLAGATSSRLSVVARRARHGFETAIVLRRSAARVYEVRALGAGGQVLGTSRAFTAH